MVEAAGVEPASEKVTGQETTCLFTFMPRAFAALRRSPQDVRGLRSERTRSGSYYTRSVITGVCELEKL